MMLSLLAERQQISLIMLLQILMLMIVSMVAAEMIRCRLQQLERLLMPCLARSPILKKFNLPMAPIRSQSMSVTLKAVLQRCTQEQVAQIPITTHFQTLQVPIKS